LRSNSWTYNYTRCIPARTKQVEPYKDKALFWHNMWNETGRPREGYVAQIRRATRAAYHRAIRRAIKENDSIARDKLAESLLKNWNGDF
jgi:hypothetical protein